MKAPNARRDVPNEIEIEIQAGTTMPATTSTITKKGASASHLVDDVEALGSSTLVGGNYNGDAVPGHYQEDDDDDVLALRDSFEETDHTDIGTKQQKEAREETTPFHQNPTQPPNKPRPLIHSIKFLMQTKI